MQDIESLYRQLSAAWEPYGHPVSLLPDELRERHGRIYSVAIRRAGEQGRHPDSLVESVNNDNDGYQTMHYVQLTFFRPEEVTREQTMIPAELFNHSRLLLGRSNTDCQFVPIRSMQYQAVITSSEIIFVDAQDYAVHDGEGGRLIVMAWEMGSAASRDSLTEPVPITEVHYHEHLDDLRRPLQQEFYRAMNLMLERQLEHATPCQSMKVVPIG